MNFKFLIAVAMVALLAVTGFAAADRLPQEVPENQVFTIDTLVDGTGAFAGESEMQWTLDSQGLDRTRRVSNNLPGGATFAAAALVGLSPAPSATFVASPQLAITALRSHPGVVVGTNGAGALMQINIIDVPAPLLNDLVDPVNLPGVTFQDIIAAIDAIAGAFMNDDWTDSGSIHDTMLNPTEEIMILTWTDALRSNGGKLSLNQNIDFDSKNKGNGLHNLEVEKVLTYASTEGAHLVGAEEWTLDVAGSYEATADTIRCVFASSASDFFPAFCNVVKAKSELVNINSAQISTKGAARSVAATGDIPAALSYQIAVTPDSNSGSGFADGTVKTLFAGSIMEARDDHLTPSATNNWKDAASFTGGIKNFQKTFNYESGFTI